MALLGRLARPALLASVVYDSTVYLRATPGLFFPASQRLGIASLIPRQDFRYSSLALRDQRVDNRAPASGAPQLAEPRRLALRLEELAKVRQECQGQHAKRIAGSRRLRRGDQATKPGIAPRPLVDHFLDEVLHPLRYAPPSPPASTPPAPPPVFDEPTRRPPATKARGVQIVRYGLGAPHSEQG